jgi:hypothetical protein
MINLSFLFLAHLGLILSAVRHNTSRFLSSVVSVHSVTVVSAAFCLTFHHVLFISSSVHFCSSIHFSTKRYHSLPRYTGEIPLSSFFLKFLLQTASSLFFLHSTAALTAPSLSPHSTAALRNDEARFICCRYAGRTEAKRNHTNERTNSCRQHAVSSKIADRPSWHSALYSVCLHRVASSNRSLSRFLTARLRKQSI